MKRNKLIFLIDGNFFAWRADATRKLSTSKGIPTGVISGMLQSIKTCHGKFRYDRLIVCWDFPGGKNFRQRTYPEYKQNRAESRDKHKSLFWQMRMMRNMFRTLNVRQAMLRGIEGDDIMGLVTNHWRDRGHKVIIASADRDLLQLIKHGVKIYRPITDELVGLKEFRNMYEGLNPEDLIKVKSLMGDKGDNIPGLKGIGEKRAIKIVKHWGSLKRLVESSTLDKYDMMVQDNIEQVNLAYKLVKILVYPEELELDEVSRCDRMLQRLHGRRRIEWDEIRKQIRKFEMKHRNFNALAEQLSLQIE